MKKPFSLFPWFRYRKSRPTNHGKADDMIADGHRLEDEGQHEMALECYRAAMKCAPGYARVYLNAGNAMLALEKTEEAIACYRSAVRLAPDYAHAHFNLGKALYLAKRPELAIAAYQDALRQNVGLSEAHIAIGAAYEEMGNIEQAIAAYLAAIAINPRFAEAHYNLALLYMQQGELDSAVATLQHALEIRPNYPDALENLASAFVKIGFAREAIAQLREARQLEPDSYAHHSHYLLGMNYLADFGDAEIFSEHAAYGKKFGSGFVLPKHYSNDPDPVRRLRIGYVSGDFRQHPVQRFIELLLERHNRDQVEVYCYNTLDKPDVVTERIKLLADQWRETLGLDDDAMARLIRDDRIDILVDLSGHTGFQRLAVFARKPAPVQATWLGYLGTTGLETMDYRICDSYTDPPGLTEQCHTEKLARLPDCQWCYRPPHDLPPPPPLPMLANGYITFGSFNNIAKLNEQVLTLWAQLLGAVPDARLLIAAMTASSLAKERILAVFERYGINPDRLDFRSRLTTQAYYQTCQEVDIALDPFPYNGGTTSIDLLCLGVPFITIVGTRAIARGGFTLLSNLGLTQFAASNEDEYIDIARSWACRAADLSKLRTALPGCVESSPLRDEMRFVVNMERLYRTMWKSWIAERRA